MKRGVSFGNLTVTEYPIILGENPACTGCPITIDWKPMRRYSCNLDVYEQHRRYTRRSQETANAIWSQKESRRRLVLPVRKRTQMLLDAGYTPEQIIKRTLQAAEIRDQREESIRRSSTQEQLHSLGKQLSKLNLKKSFTKLSGVNFGTNNNNNNINTNNNDTNNNRSTDGRLKPCRKIIIARSA